MTYFQDFFESAQARSAVVTTGSNDPMTPITEEGAPEFPSKFEESGECDTPETVLQNSTDTGDSQTTHDENSLILKEEEALGSEASVKTDTELTDELSSLLPEKETVDSQLKTVDLEDATSCGNSHIFNTKLAVSSENLEVSSVDTEHFNPHSTTEPNTDGSCLPNGELHESNEVLTNCVDSENCHLKDDKIMFPGTDQVHCEKTSSSSCGTNLLIEDINEGGGIVKMQCEKCPA